MSVHTTQICEITLTSFHTHQTKELFNKAWTKYDTIVFSNKQQLIKIKNLERIEMFAITVSCKVDINLF